MGIFGKDEFDKGVDIINNFLKKINVAERLEKKEKDFATVMIHYKGDFIQTAVIQPKGGKSSDFILSAYVCHLPKQENVLLPLCLQLLDWNNFLTGVTHFSIDSAHERVFLVLRRSIEDLNFSEFQSALDDISAVRFNSTTQLRQKFGI